jgi:hypothetical protein
LSNFIHVHICMVHVMVIQLGGYLFKKNEVGREAGHKVGQESGSNIPNIPTAKKQEWTKINKN